MFFTNNDKNVSNKNLHKFKLTKIAYFRKTIEVLYYNKIVIFSKCFKLFLFLIE